MSPRRIVAAFPGQGTHWRGMGMELYRDDEAFREALDEAEAVAAALGTPFLATLQADTGRTEVPWNDLAITYPAIISIEWALLRALAARGVVPDAVIGASLGEIAALASAGAWGLDTALAIAAAHARAFIGRLPAGGMAAVVGGEAGLRAAAEQVGCILAADVAPDVFSVAGDEAALARFLPHATAMGAAIWRLWLPHPFHHPAMDAVEPGYLDEAPRGRWRPRLPAWSCALAGVVEVADARHAWFATRAPIRLRETLMAALGDETVLIDCGPMPSMLASAVRLIPGLVGHHILDQRPGAAARLDRVAAALTPAIAF